MLCKTWQLKPSPQEIFLHGLKKTHLPHPLKLRMERNSFKGQIHIADYFFLSKEFSSSPRSGITFLGNLAHLERRLLLLLGCPVGALYSCGYKAEAPAGLFTRLANFSAVWLLSVLEDVAEGVSLSGSERNVRTHCSA